MALDPQVTFPCSVNSIPFYPAFNMRRSVDAIYNFGQSSYINSLLQWQTKLPYYCKALFNDQLSFQFKTQNNLSAVNFARMYVCKSKRDSSTGMPIPGDIISAFTTPLNTSAISGGLYYGTQTPGFDTYTDPLTGFTQYLRSYMWSFSFGDYLNPDTDSGIYFIQFDNADFNNNVTTWFSEPILVFGLNASLRFPLTLLIEGNNNYNKNDILMTNWNGFVVGARPVFRIRVEADILDYEPKGIYLGFLQDSFLQKNTYITSWKTWALNIGSISGGIPSVMFDIVNKFLELDILYINNQAYIYDQAAGGSASPSNAWKMKKPRVKGLIAGTIPIRYKYANQFYAAPFNEDGRVFTEEFGDEFA